MEDSDIIELFWRRSEEAVTEAAKKYGSYCRSIAGNILGCDQDTEEEAMTVLKSILDAYG